MGSDERVIRADQSRADQNVYDLAACSAAWDNSTHNVYVCICVQTTCIEVKGKMNNREKLPLHLVVTLFREGTPVRSGPPRQTDRVPAAHGHRIK